MLLGEGVDKYEYSRTRLQKIVCEHFTCQIMRQNVVVNENETSYNGNSSLPGAGNSPGSPGLPTPFEYSSTYYCTS